MEDIKIHSTFDGYFKDDFGTDYLTNAQHLNEFIALQDENGRLKISNDLMFDKIRQLTQQIEEYKQKHDEAIKYIVHEINSSSIQYERRNKQQDLVYKVAHERILSILKGKE